MKKWLDDLYAILLKRGFNTLDNSLKNYDTLKRYIAKETQTGSIASGQTLSYNLNEYDCKINDILLIKCVLSGSRLAVLTVVRVSVDGYIRLNVWGVSPSISASTSGNLLNITNNTDSDLTYTLFISTL